MKEKTLTENSGKIKIAVSYSSWPFSDLMIPVYGDACMTPMRKKYGQTFSSLQGGDGAEESNLKVVEEPDMAKQ